MPEATHRWRKPSQTLAATAESRNLGCAKCGTWRMRRASLLSALRESCWPGALRMAVLPVCFGDHKSRGGRLRARYSCPRVRTLAQRLLGGQQVRGNGTASALIFRRRGMSAAGGCGFGAIVFPKVALVARPPNVLSLSRPRAFTLQQRDAQRRAEPRRGSAGPANGTWSAAVKS